MPLINSEVPLGLNWSKKSVIAATNAANQDTAFSITDTKLYIPVVILLTHNNAKMLEQLKSSLKRTINWNKYQLKVSTEKPSQFLDFLIDQDFQGVNRLFVLLFEDEVERTSDILSYF